MATQNHTVEVVDNNNMMDMKKKRRSRRSKQFSPQTASTSGYTRETNLTGGIPMLNHEGPIGCMPPRGSYIAFNSLPTMHMNEQKLESESLPVQQTFSSVIGGRVLSSSCSNPIVYEGSRGPYINEDPLLCFPTSSHKQTKYFTPHWPVEAVHDALEKGRIFKALFRVNAHNRLEAYCKIECVQTDVLISEVAAQNRAVEGDIVAIEVDPPSIWTRMRGFSTGTAVSSASLDNGTFDSEISEFVQENMNGKNRLDTDNGLSSCQNGVSCGIWPSMW